jgi:tetraacyldisaccharide 4'-kinase
MHPSDVWHGRSLAARLVRGLLTPASWLYAAGWQTYLAAYRLGLKRPQRPHPRVLCIGNLQVGGSGKSPLTLYLAHGLRERGWEVVIGGSGYGSPAAEAAQRAPDGPLDPAEWGDEPAMFRWLASDLPIVVGRRRPLAAKIAYELAPEGVFVMDDGFQHLPLEKGITILIDPERPPNARCLPAGPYREPRPNRSRADLVLPGRFRIVSDLRLVGPDGSSAEPDEVNVLCAIGRPERFAKDLEERGLRIREVRALPDHDPLDRGTLFAGLSPEVPLVVTAKDWIKLRRRKDIESMRPLIALQQVRVEPEDEFWAWLLGRLDELGEARDQK